MKDYRVSMALAIPSALGLLALLWILRRKSGSGPGDKKSPKSLPKEKEFTVEGTENVRFKHQTQHVEKDGVTITQRKIPETQARDRGSSDLDSHQAPDLTAGSQAEIANKADSEVREKPTVVQTKEVSPTVERPFAQGDGLTNAERRQVGLLISSAIQEGLSEAHARLSLQQDSPLDKSLDSGVLSGSPSSERLETFKLEVLIQKEEDTHFQAATILSEQLERGSDLKDRVHVSSRCTPEDAQESHSHTSSSGGDEDVETTTDEKKVLVFASSECMPEDAHESHSHTSSSGGDDSVETTADEKDANNFQATSSLEAAESSICDIQAEISQGSRSAEDIGSQLEAETCPITAPTTVYLQSAATCLVQTSVQTHHLTDTDLNANNILNLEEHEEQNHITNTKTSSPAEQSTANEKNYVLDSEQCETVCENNAASVMIQSTEARDSCITNTSNSPVSKWLPYERFGTKDHANPWGKKTLTSTSSMESASSFGVEEIESIWGITSNSELDTDISLSLVDTTTSCSMQDTTTSSSELDMDIKSSSEESILQKGFTSVSSQDVGASGNEVLENPSPADTEPKEDSPVKSNSPSFDNNSEGSNDSGRGGSEHDTPGQGQEQLVHFDFNMPSDLCGRFIGKHGKNINYLKSKTGAHVSLTSNPFTADYQICQVVGTQAEVDDALAMIRRKFPLQENPMLTMFPINFSPAPSQIEHPVLVPDVVQLSLPEGVSVEVYVSAIVDAGQVFVQQPTHRSFMSLEKLNYFLNIAYGQDPNIPSVPTPVESGLICVCENEGFWYRAMIMTPEDENGDCQVKFVDYGGYAQMPVASLKQVRTDFMALPFQAVECFMANITPNQDEAYFSSEATLALSEMTQGQLLHCQVVARTESGVPYIHLYQISPERNSAVMINRALVNSQLVRWIEIL